MNKIEAETLLSNLLKRVETFEDGSLKLPGILTKKERESLVIALSLFDEGFHPTQSDADKLSGQQIQSEDESLKLNMGSLELPAAPSNMRLCFDFGTAMSKVTLAKDGDEDGYKDDEKLDDIVVLKLGNPGNQEETSENMLISSVYIDDDNALWFGQKAVDMSRQDNKDRPHQRLDSIKRFLSEDNLDAEIAPQYNPTEVGVTYRDIILAYLMFLTWAVGVCAEEDYPRNIKRRFAMPCFDGEDSDISRKAEKTLRNLLGEAQVLADTFCTMFDNGGGIPLELYLGKVKELRREHREYEFIAESITEPIGVANSFLSPHHSMQQSIVLVIDVGAGTTDMALFCFWNDKEENINKAAQINGSSRTLEEAGDYLDRLLMEFILNKADIGHEHPKNKGIRSIISLRIREYKEILFVNEHVDVYSEVPEYTLDVSINLDDFLEIKQIKDFSDSLESTMRDILENVDKSFITGIMFLGRLTVILTGGSANLPMIKELASGTLDIHENKVQLQCALQFPAWLGDYPDLKQDYPRIAVSLGGARKNLIQIKDAISVTAIGAPPPVAPSSFV